MNRTLMILCVGLLLCLVTFPSIAQPPETLWTRTFNSWENSVDKGFDVQQTADGGFVVVGFMEPEEGGNDAWVIRTDPNGDEIWNQTLGGDQTDEGYGIVQCADGSFVVVGKTSSTGEGWFDAWLFKMDANGNRVWARTFGDTELDRGYSLQQTTDGGFILVGTTQPSGSQDTDVLLVKTDDFGNQLWQRTVGWALEDYGRSVQQTTDGGYIVAGHTDSIGQGHEDGLLIKTDSAGELEWHRTFGGTRHDLLYDVCQTSDGGYVMVGETDSLGADYRDELWMIKTDPSGYLQWSRTYGGWLDDEGVSIRQTSDGGFVMAGTHWVVGTPEMWLIRTDELGNYQWSKLFNNGVYDNNDGGHSVRQTSDGGYIMTGFIGYPTTRADIALIRVASDLAADLTLSIAPVNAPIVLPAGGGSFQFTALVQNLTDYTQTFAAWSAVDLPNGTTYGPVLLRYDLNLAPGGQFDVVLTQEVPGVAPSGVYVYRGSVGFYPFNTFDTSELEFEKLGPSGQSNTTAWNTGILSDRYVFVWPPF